MEGARLKRISHREVLPCIVVQCVSALQQQTNYTEGRVGGGCSLGEVSFLLPSVFSAHLLLYTARILYSYTYFGDWHPLLFRKRTSWS